METANIYTVFAVTGGYHNGPAIGYASTVEKADVMSQRKGFFGSDSLFLKVPVIEIGGKVYVLKDTTPIQVDDMQAISDAELKEQTLKSLTNDQKRVLGLN